MRDEWNGSRPHQHLLAGSLIQQWVTRTSMWSGVFGRRRGVLLQFSFLGMRLHFLGRRIGSSQVWLDGWHRKTPRCFSVPVLMAKVKPLLRLINKQKTLQQEGFVNRRLNGTESSWFCFAPSMQTWTRIWSLNTNAYWMTGRVNEWLIIVVVMVKIIMLR